MQKTQLLEHEALTLNFQRGVQEKIQDKEFQQIGNVFQKGSHGNSTQIRKTATEIKKSKY